jgi:hypothetical protein
MMLAHVTWALAGEIVNSNADPTTKVMANGRRWAAPAGVTWRRMKDFGIPILCRLVAFGL